MKNVQPIQRLSLFALAVFALCFSACDPTDGLIVKEKEAVLQLGEQKTTFAGDGTVYRLRVQAGVFNIFNKKYWVSQDVVGVAATSATKDLYTASGTTVGASIVLRW